MDSKISEPLFFSKLKHFYPISDAYRTVPPPMDSLPMSTVAPTRTRPSTTWSGREDSFHHEHGHETKYVVQMPLPSWVP